MAFCLFVGFTQAQINTPAASPGQKIEQKIGLTDVTVEYSRPGKKGRKVFGTDGIVEYNKFWRTGANSATKVTFSEDVKIGGKDLMKGSYAILTKPNAAAWTVNFYPYESGSWGSYTEKVPTVSLEAKTMSLGNEVESMTINFNDFTDVSGNLNIMWDKTGVSLPILVGTDAAVMESIERVMAGPSNNDFYNAASYFHSTGKDLNQALEWIQKATKVESPKFWQVRREALILGDLGKYKEAIKAAKLSKELAQTAGNDEYVKMNDASIAEWSMKK